MKNWVITRKYEFDAGHRVYGHESRCANLHGHRYVVEITATAETLDSIGRVVDFSVLKEKIGGWIDEKWDHTMIIFREDNEAIGPLSALSKNKPIYISDWNPTAENMASFLLHDLCPELMKDTGILITKVVVHETPNCRAEVEL